MNLALIGIAAILLLSGCGGGSSEPSASPPPDRVPGGAELDFQLAGWKTNFDKRTVRLSEFMSGGPGKDGIPAIDRPQFLPAAQIRFLEPREPVIELAVNGEVRAYPIQILIWHEIVNDELGGVPVAVTFCPLCNTAIVFDRRVDGRTLDFGTTGNLRHSDLVMYDRQTESWWQQFGGEGLVGHYAGERLREVPARIVSWRDFKRRHPGAEVLSRDTGHWRSYGENPYEGYDDVSKPPFFPAANEDDKRLPPKERVVFVERGGDSVAVPYSALAKRPAVRIVVGGHRLVVRFRRGVASSLGTTHIADGRDVGSAEVLEDGKLVPFSEPFWFAVAAFRPKVELH